MKIWKILLCEILLALPVFAEESDDRQTATSLHYVSHELDTRQDKLTAGTNAALTYTNSAGGVEQRTVKSDLTGGTTDTSLPQVNAVNAGLNSKQDDIDPINDHTAVTYTENIGTIGRKGIYQDTGTYAEQSDNLIDAKTFNAALKAGLDNEFVCGGRSPTGICWLWSIDNETDETISVPGKNLFDKDTMLVEHKAIRAGNVSANKPLGSEMDDYYWNCTDYISVLPDTTYTYTVPNSSGANAAGMVFYRNKSVEGAISGITQAAPLTRTFTTPTDCYYVRFSWPRGNGNNVQLELGPTATTYEPYGDKTMNVYIPQNQSAQNQ